MIASACHIATTETRETVGIDFDDPDAITAETLAARVPKIQNNEGAIRYHNAMVAVGPTFDRL